MSDTDQDPVPPHRPRRRLRWLIVLAAILCVLAMIAALTLWSARPRSYTYVSEPTVASPHVALVIRFPVGWECRQIRFGDPGNGRIVLPIRRKLLTGLARWWSEHVLRLDTGHNPI